MSKTESNCDVLIAGAGPAGLMMACQLTLHNIPFRIIDKKASPVICSGALIIHARTLEIFQQLGLAEKAIKAGITAQSLNIRFNNKKPIALDFGDAAENLTPFPFLLMLEQWKTENLLEEFLEQHNQKVENNTELLGFTQQDEFVVSEIKKPDGSIELVRSKFLIGADGNGSLVRTQLKIPFLGVSHKPRLFISDCEAELPFSEQEICFAFSKNYTAGFFPLTRNRRRVDGLIPALQAKETVSFDEVKDFFASDSGADVALKNPQWFSVFRSHSRCVTTYRQNRCFLVGDAAHIHSPVGAQGMNTGIQDAYNLAWKLAFFIQGKASAELLDSYEQERRPVALNVIRFTDFAYKLMTSDSFLAKFSRLRMAPFLLPLLLKWSSKNTALRSRLFSWISGIGIRYKLSLNSDLSKDKFPAHAPKPGERLPYLNLEPGNKILSTHELLIPLTYTLIVFGNPEFFQKIIEEYSDIISVKHIPDETANQQIFKAFGVKTEAYYLVRPDMYITWRGRGFKDEVLRYYLQKTLN